MVLLFRDFYEKSYKVPMCSGVACVWFIFFALVLIIPWVACWRAGGKCEATENFHINHSHDLNQVFLHVRILGQGAHILRAP